MDHWRVDELEVAYAVEDVAVLRGHLKRPALIGVVPEGARSAHQPVTDHVEARVRTLRCERGGSEIGVYARQHGE